MYEGCGRESFLDIAPELLSKPKWLPYYVQHAKISLTAIVNMLRVKCILFSWPSGELINLLGAEGSIESRI